MTLTLVAIINAVFAISVLAVIVGLQLWSIWTTDQEHGGPGITPSSRLARSETEVAEEALPSGNIAIV